MPLSSIIRQLLVVAFATLAVAGTANQLFAQAVPVGGGDPTKTDSKPLLVGDPILKLRTARKERPSKNTAVVNTDYFRVVIAERGGQIISFKHKDAINELRNNAELVTKNPFEFLLYMHPNPDTYGGATNAAYINLAISWVDALQKSNYRLTENTVDGNTTVSATTTLVARVGRRNVTLLVTKEFQFFKNMHYWRFAWKVTNRSGQNVRLDGVILSAFVDVGPALQGDDARASISFFNFFYSGEELTKYSTTDQGGGIFACYGGGGDTQEKEHLKVEQSIGYFGTSSRFMIMAMQPLTPTKALHSYKKTAGREAHIQLGLPGQTIPKRGEISLPFIIYTGPKVHEYVKPDRKDKDQFPELKKLHSELTDAFDFGITAPVRDFIVAILQILYKVIPNYGIGIIIFALLFKLVFWPLNQKQAESMKKMSALQPEMKEINDKYKDNAQEKQKRTMEMYKKHKINPLSGCLPMLIQLPIFIALYTAFSDSYELWKSPFISGWINDLSEPDTVYTFAKSMPVIGGFNLNILPLFMGASQFLQSKFTQVTGDSNQQKMMQFMPLLMLFFFWSMPSGVVLYWTIQNLLSIGQQLYTNARDDKKAAAS